jgi:hypothetical protein
LDTSALSPELTVDAILAGTTARRSPIVVIDYDDAWGRLFEELARPVHQSLVGCHATLRRYSSSRMPGSR